MPRTGSKKDAVQERPKRQASQGLQYITTASIVRSEKKDIEKAIEASLREAGGASKSTNRNNGSTSSAKPGLLSDKPSKVRKQCHDVELATTSRSSGIKRAVDKIAAGESNSDEKRPKRNAAQKAAALTSLNALLQQEELDLKRAIQQSLTEAKVPKNELTDARVEDLLANEIIGHQNASAKALAKKEISAKAKDCSERSSEGSLKKPKIPPQRKFAQGTTNYTPATTPVKQGSGPSIPVTEVFKNIKPNTNDFLTFLCFRRTPMLPPNLNFSALDKKPAQTNASATSRGRGDLTHSVEVSSPVRAGREYSKEGNGQVKVSASPSVKSAQPKRVLNTTCTPSNKQPVVLSKKLADKAWSAKRKIEEKLITPTKPDNVTTIKKTTAATKILPVLKPVPANCLTKRPSTEKSKLAIITTDVTTKSLSVAGKRKISATLDRSSDISKDCSKIEKVASSLKSPIGTGDQGQTIFEMKGLTLKPGCPSVVAAKRVTRSASSIPQNDDVILRPQRKEVERNLNSPKPIVRFKSGFCLNSPSSSSSESLPDTSDDEAEFEHFDLPRVTRSVEHLKQIRDAASKKDSSSSNSAVVRNDVRVSVMQSARTLRRSSMR